MSSRYSLATKGVLDLVNKVRAQHFEELATAEILVLMDSQKSTSLGRIKRARLAKASSVLNSLAEQTTERTYDYVLILDKKVWDKLSIEDQEQEIFHVLCSAWKNTENDQDKYKLAAPDYAVFAKEITQYPDWQRWHKSMADHAAQVHEEKNTALSGQASIEDYAGKDNSESAYWNESEAALKDMAAQRGLALPDAFDKRSDEDRVGYLVRLLELSDKERAAADQEAAA